MDLSPPRGTRDFFPEDLRLRTWLFDHFRAVARLHGFEEYDAPVVETRALYTRKAGEEIVGQLYIFEDKSGRELALRPEMTPSLARMILQKGRSLTLPAKWFSLPQCWRYERMTRGRKREHYQWNMDVVGVAGPEAEAELLSALVTLFRRVGLGPADVGIKVSSRKVLQAVLGRAGVGPDRFAPVCVLVDKLDKVPRPEIEAQLAELGLEASLVDRILDTLALRSVDGLAAILGDEDPAVSELRRLFALADGYGISEWITLDASVVRGLAYYTGIVFEAFDRGATLRAVCGGGRYDHLLSTFGGEDLPMVGFGFGDVVILELLSDRGLLPTLAAGVDDLVFAFDSALYLHALALVRELRDAGRAVDLVLEDKRAKWAFKHADRLGAKRVVMLAPREWDQGNLVVKDLATGGESVVPRAGFADA